MNDIIRNNPSLAAIITAIQKNQNILRNYDENRGIIDDADMLSRLEEMTRRKQLELMKKAVFAVNRRKVSINKKGYYQILIDESSNRITAKTEYGLYLKLYERYFGTFREVDPTIKDVFEEYYDWRLQYDTCCSRLSIPFERLLH